MYFFRNLFKLLCRFYENAVKIRKNSDEILEKIQTFVRQRHNVTNFESFCNKISYHTREFAERLN